MRPSMKFRQDMLGVLPLEDVKLKFKTCAVVGNSGSVSGGGKGAEIDAADAVFRINYAPTKVGRCRMIRCLVSGLVTCIYLAFGVFDQKPIKLWSQSPNANLLQFVSNATGRSLSFTDKSPG